MEVRTIMLIVQISSSGILVITAWLNLKILQKQKRLYTRDEKLQRATDRLVIAAIEWRDGFGTPDHPLTIGKLRSAVADYELWNAIAGDEEPK